MQTRKGCPVCAVTRYRGLADIRCTTYKPSLIGPDFGAVLHHPPLGLSLALGLRFGPVHFPCRPLSRPACSSSASLLE